MAADRATDAIDAAKTAAGTAAAEGYDARAELLAEVLGRRVEPGDPDRRVIEAWADGVTGSILDVGSGTGRWAGHLAQLGHTVEGLEPAGRFVEMARRAFPAVPFRHAAVSDLAASDERWGGVLAWYSLIHMDAHELPGALSTVRRVLDDGGRLLMSFFTGPRYEPVTHPATTAYLWPVDDMRAALRRAGFEVTGQHTNPGAPHAVITARAAAPSTQPTGHDTLVT